MSLGKVAQSVMPPTLSEYLLILAEPLLIQTERLLTQAEHPLTAHPINQGDNSLVL